MKEEPKDQAAEFVVAKVNGTLWDLDRPLEADCVLSYRSIHDPDGRAVFWHSTVHILGDGAEHEYGCLLSHGPPIATGWPMIKAKQPFERLEVSKTDLLELFQYSKDKLHYVGKFLPDGGFTNVYRNGSLVDLCLGPMSRTSSRSAPSKSRITAPHTSSVTRRIIRCSAYPASPSLTRR